jgi:bla regulator protein blaR1
MLAWMLYVIMVTLLLSTGSFLAERAARLKRIGTRWIWISAIVASLLMPTLIASVAFDLPDVVGAGVARKIIVLRQATSAQLSPAMWIAGSAEPPAWRAADPTAKQLWLGVSAAMLLALLASGVHLLLRKRRWHSGAMAGAQVYVTPDIGPAVVGLLRPRIVVPQWLTDAPPSQQASVIAHEQSHLEAGDPRLFTLALALLVLMPWNLPLWWQLRRLRYAIEIDCDARVLKGGIDPAHYGETLIVVGERQSAYVGAVAAMSESKSFLEERIEHMIRKPVRWQRLGAATLASFAIALTALAAQVSPPNAETPAAAAAPGKQEHKQIELPTSTLDRYIGQYKLGEGILFTVKREGSQLRAQVTGQTFADIYPESETRFFYKIVNAQLEFAVSPDGAAESATLFQNGAVIPMTRIDSAAAAQLNANRDAKIASQTPTPGGEAAVRRMSDSIAAGKPNYNEMSPELAGVTKAQLSRLQASIVGVGALQSVTFRNVTEQGADLYLAKYEHGTLAWRIILAQDGKIATALITPDL